MTEHVHAVVENDTIMNTLVLAPEDARDFDFLGELVDITDLDPRPGIGWTRNDGAWFAPVMPEPEPEPLPEVGEADPETT